MAENVTNTRGGWCGEICLGAAGDFGNRGCAGRAARLCRRAGAPDLASPSVTHVYLLTAQIGYG
jgi:hypothetical protein